MSSNGIEFAPWPTEVENDELIFVGVKYGGYAKTEFVQEGLSLELELDYGDESDGLEVTFISREKKAGVCFSFDNVSAFRVLDEHGLVELWSASSSTPRPAQTTFKVKGHKWQDESELSWVMSSCEYSFMVATGSNCLEVIANCEPTVTLLPATVTKQITH
ncbi:hypothetical protein [Altererythrobacter sp. ZODW24]|uniref:hypothetical protein n=1 Tax=Altererythrobacter sp. ZODW24 TaxID=2185142 RepID=UPI000DF7B9BB|nr:hypothetical protein [Altererythrobacter sp. ZODW24]